MEPIDSEADRLPDERPDPELSRAQILTRRRELGLPVSDEIVDELARRFRAGQLPHLLWWVMTAAVASGRVRARRAG